MTQQEIKISSEDLVAVLRELEAENINLRIIRVGLQRRLEALQAELTRNGVNKSSAEEDAP